MAGVSGGVVGEAGAGTRGLGGGPARPVPLAGVGGPGGPRGEVDGGRSWRGGGVWSSHPITAVEVESLRRCYPSILELPEDLVKAARGEWEMVTVVARSLGRRVPAEWLAKDVSARLGLGYEAEFFILAEDHFALRFKTAEDRDKALTGGPWVVAGQLVAMEAWKPGFVPGPSSISSATVWVRLPKLPMELWGEEILMKIAAVAGRPLVVDEFSRQRKRMGFARAKVVVDISKPLVPGVLIKGEEEVFWQAFVYESLPEFCYGCARIGHGHERCPFRTTAQPGEAGVGGDGERAPVEGADASTGSQVPGGCKLAFGPWLATARSRPPIAGKTAKAPAPAPPSSGTSRPAPSPAATSSQAAGGWLKPAKVARRKSPVKGSPADGGGGSGETGRGSIFAPLSELDDTGDTGALGSSLGLNSTGQKRPRSPLSRQKGGTAGDSARSSRGRSRASFQVEGVERARMSGVSTAAGSGRLCRPPAVPSAVGPCMGSSGASSRREEETGIMVDGIFRAGGQERGSVTLDSSQPASKQGLEAGESIMAMDTQGVEDLGAGRAPVDGRGEELSTGGGRAGLALAAGEVTHPEAVARAKAALSVMGHEGGAASGSALPDEASGEGVVLHCETHSMEVVEEPLPQEAQGSLMSEVQ